METQSIHNKQDIASMSSSITEYHAIRTILESCTDDIISVIHRRLILEGRGFRALLDEMYSPSVARQRITQDLLTVHGPENAIFVVHRLLKEIEGFARQFGVASIRAPVSITIQKDTKTWNQFPIYHGDAVVDFSFSFITEHMPRRGPLNINNACATQSLLYIALASNMWRLVMDRMAISDIKRLSRPAKILHCVAGKDWNNLGGVDINKIAQIYDKYCRAAEGMSSSIGTQISILHPFEITFKAPSFNWTVKRQRKCLAKNCMDSVTYTSHNHLPIQVTDRQTKLDIGQIFKKVFKFGRSESGKCGSCHTAFSKCNLLADRLPHYMTLHLDKQASRALLDSISSTMRNGFILEEALHMDGVASHKKYNFAGAVMRQSYINEEGHFYAVWCLPMALHTSFDWYTYRYDGLRNQGEAVRLQQDERKDLLTLKGCFGPPSFPKLLVFRSARDEEVH